MHNDFIYKDNESELEKRSELQQLMYIISTKNYHNIKINSEYSLLQILRKTTEPNQPK